MMDRIGSLLRELFFRIRTPSVDTASLVLPSGSMPQRDKKVRTPANWVHSRDELLWWTSRMVSRERAAMPSRRACAKAKSLPNEKSVG